MVVRAALSTCLALCLAWCALSARANPIPADELSLLNGADVYSLNCAECHGWSLLDTYYARDADEEYELEFDLSDLIGEEESEEQEYIYIEDEEAWPEWAEMPDPGARASDPTVRAEMLQDLTGAIEDVYGDGEPVDAQVLEPSLSVFETGEQDVDPNGPQQGVTALDDPDSYLYGTTEQALYESIAGTGDRVVHEYAGSFDSDDRIWDLVNFIRSFWLEADREY